MVIRHLIKNVLHRKRKDWIVIGKVLYSECADLQAGRKLAKQLQAKIKMRGPITVAEYMKEALINPSAGYYMHQNAIGSKGDFITSPEISQMFGELIGVWCIHEWMKLNCPDPLHVVELGPGTGALLEDMNRAFIKFPQLLKSVSYHCVEVSPRMQSLQEERLCPDKTSDDLTPFKNSHNFYKMNKTKHEIPIYWYSSLFDVPQNFSFYIAHEFFDALPIHKLQKTNNGWREVLIDVEMSEDPKFIYVLSSQPTPASQSLIFPNETREEVEVCAEAVIIIEELSKRLIENGGFALIADYGHNGTKTDTFRAFRKHKLWPPLKEPGTADLTADVDFSFLKRIAENKVNFHGPINQGTFLKNMAIEARLQKLVNNRSDETREALKKGYDLLTNPLHMGERFKFVALYPKVLENFLKQFPPAGFY